MYLDNNIKSLNVYHESILHISLSKMMVQVKYLSCIESFALKQHNINTLHSCWHYEGYEGYTVSPAGGCTLCCTSITLTNDKLHLIQTTISHILRASGQSLHSYNNDDYHNGPYDPYPFHVPTK